MRVISPSLATVMLVKVAAVEPPTASTSARRQKPATLAAPRLLCLMVPVSLSHVNGYVRRLPEEIVLHGQTRLSDLDHLPVDDAVADSQHVYALARVLNDAETVVAPPHHADQSE